MRQVRKSWQKQLALFSLLPDSIPPASMLSIRYERLGHLVETMRYWIRASTLEKRAFYNWEDGVGLLHEVWDGRHPHIDNPNLRPAVERVLHCVEMLLTGTESFESKYGLQEVPGEGRFAQDMSTGALISDRDLFKVSYAKFQGRIRKQQKEVSLLKKTQWAIASRNEFQTLISDLDGMIEDL